MNVRDFERERATLENVLKAKDLDFTAAFLAVRDLGELILTHPETVGSETIHALEGVVKNSGFSRQTQCFFLYKEAAGALTSIIVHTISESLAKEAICVLKNLLGTAVGDAQRAAAQALGCLPVSVHGPQISEETIDDAPRVKWQEILEEKGVTNCNPPALVGRSLVVSLDKEHRLFVVKLACAEHCLQHMYREAVWMEHLCSAGYAFSVRFDIPVAIKIQGSY